MTTTMDMGPATLQSITEDTMVMTLASSTAVEGQLQQLLLEEAQLHHQLLLLAGIY